jgi:hypothetical protein
VVEKWILGKDVGSFVVLGCGVGVANRLNGKSGATTIYYVFLRLPKEDLLKSDCRILKELLAIIVSAFFKKPLYLKFFWAHVTQI